MTYWQTGVRSLIRRLIPAVMKWTANYYHLIAGADSNHRGTPAITKWSARKLVGLKDRGEAGSSAQTELPSYVCVSSDISWGTIQYSFCHQNDFAFVKCRQVRAMQLTLSNKKSKEQTWYLNNDGECITLTADTYYLRSVIFIIPTIWSQLSLYKTPTTWGQLSLYITPTTSGQVYIYNIYYLRSVIFIYKTPTTWGQLSLCENT